MNAGVGQCNATINKKWRITMRGRHNNEQMDRCHEKLRCQLSGRWRQTEKRGAHQQNGAIRWQPDEMPWHQALAQWQNERVGINLMMIFNQRQHNKRWLNNKTSRHQAEVQREGEEKKPTQETTKKERHNVMMVQ